MPLGRNTQLYLVCNMSVNHLVASQVALPMMSPRSSDSADTKAAVCNLHLQVTTPPCLGTPSLPKCMHPRQPEQLASNSGTLTHAQGETSLLSWDESTPSHPFRDPTSVVTMGLDMNLTL